ncbi:hypothetical protein OG802_31780 [Streptomyces sp. NBC_00704]|uniref:hypothetical protein n=1 Tax=Streptomyces sp. NBC_00704 TaxID=2975809 RepID=UPI002E36D206|nr:hypothetical protein [Streptomyces sp. NBC_00704]
MVGHRDRTASVTCSSPCAMPPRSRDLAALRRFAEAHAAAHARAAAVHHDAACWCRRQRCALHEDTRVACAGSVVLVLRHDPAVGQVWTLTEVCAACASLLPHARVLSRSAAAPPPPRSAGHGAGLHEGAGAGAGAGAGPGAGAGLEAVGRPAPSGPPLPTAGPSRLVPGGFSAPSPGTGPDRADARRRGPGSRRGRGRRETGSG